MSEPFMGELRLMSFGYAPRSWAQCNGQFLPINQNQALFSLMGTTYGGNGQTTFALPDLRGRVPIHIGQGIIQGERAGEEAHTLSIAEMPAHNHLVNAATADGDNVVAAGNMLAAFNNGYRGPTNLLAMQAATITNAGGSQAHQNMQPFLTLNYCVALQGIFPSQN